MFVSESLAFIIKWYKNMLQASKESKWKITVFQGNYWTIGKELTASRQCTTEIDTPWVVELDLCILNSTWITSISDIYVYIYISTRSGNSEQVCGGLLLTARFDIRGMARWAKINSACAHNLALKKVWAPHCFQKKSQCYIATFIWIRINFKANQRHGGKCRIWYGSFI